MALTLHIGIIQLAAHYLHVVQTHHPTARHGVLRLLSLGTVLLKMLYYARKIKPVTILLQLHIKPCQSHMAHIHRLAYQPQQTHPYIQTLESGKQRLSVILIHRQPVHLHMPSEQIHSRSLYIHPSSKQLLSVAVHIILCGTSAKERSKHHQQQQHSCQRCNHYQCNSHQLFHIQKII